MEFLGKPQVFSVRRAMHHGATTRLWHISAPANVALPVIAITPRGARRAAAGGGRGGRARSLVKA
jgi:hypothetical protein